jgi:SAM-dependent methyltransferase
METAAGVTANREAIDAWDGVLFDRFLEFRDLMVEGLGAHGELALELNPPPAGGRALDIGCGFGDTTQRIAGLVGADGEAVGIDSGQRFIDLARAEAEQAGAGNVSFLVGDVQTMDLGGPFDYAFSRMGTMFFANPVAAMRNVREALAPDGRLCMVVWRQKLDNGWVSATEEVVKGLVEEDEDSDELTCGPGPFSMANANTTSQVLMNAGFSDVALRRSDIDFRIGDIERAAALTMALGPAGEAIRLAGDQAEEIRPTIEAAVRGALAQFESPGGEVVTPSSTWIVTASAASA